MRLNTRQSKLCRHLLSISGIAALTIAVAGCTKVKPNSEETLSLSGVRPSLTAAVVEPSEAEPGATALASTVLASPLTAVETSTVLPATTQVAELVLPTATPPPVPTPTPSFRIHVVGWGDTLLSIAIAYSVSVEDIMIANSLPNNIIYLGQTLKIPQQSVPAGAQTYTVQAGDTLVGIAERLGVDLDSLMRANNLSNGYFLQVGQVLVVPSSGSQVAQTSSDSGVQAASTETRVYTVQPGDTLWTIAALYNVSPYDLAVANSLGNPNVLQVGQKLIIP